jgi:peptidoglycan/LPS O-acetylase OafA/YrhL
VVLLVLFFPLIIGFGFWPAHVTLYAAIWLSIPFLFMASKRSHVDRFLGELSYPLYISHLLVISVVGRLPVLFGSTIASAVVYSIAFAALVHLLFENLIERLFKQSASPIPQPA